MTSLASNQSVTDRLRFDVISGHFAPNARLIELQLTERYQVGRAGIRSAIVELAKEGLVIREANRGARVRALSQRETIEIYEARAVIEGLLCRRAATNATQAEREELRSLLGKMQQAANQQDAPEVATLARKINERIGQIGRHQVAQELIDVLRNQSLQIPAPLLSFPGLRDRFTQEVIETVNAIISEDADGAERAVRAHFDSIISAHR